MFALVLGGFAAAMTAGLLVWLFALAGTQGLFIWGGYRPLFIGIGIAGVFPLLLALAGIPWLSEEKSIFGRILSVGAIALGGLAIVFSLILVGEILVRSRSTEKPVPALTLVDPSSGIFPRGPVGPSGPVLRLSLSSDPHWAAAGSNPGARTAVLKSLAAAEPARDAFFILGDNVELGINDGAWREETLELAAALPAMPIRSLFGNHDALVNGQYHFEKYFFPKGVHTDSGSPLYYSLEAGPATIIVLNLLWGAESLDAAQRAWLEKRLAEIPRNRPLVVLSHAFILSSGYVDEGTKMPWYDNPELATYLCPLFERAGVDLVVSGHNHYMELLERGGVYYAVVGAMGGKPDPEPTYRSPSSLWFRRGSFGRLDLDIDARGIALRFLDDQGGLLKEEYIPAAR